MAPFSIPFVCPPVAATADLLELSVRAIPQEKAARPEVCVHKTRTEDASTVQSIE